MIWGLVQCSLSENERHSEHWAMLCYAIHFSIPCSVCQRNGNVMVCVCMSLTETAIWCKRNGRNCSSLHAHTEHLMYLTLSLLSATLLRDHILSRSRYTTLAHQTKQTYARVLSHCCRCCRYCFAYAQFACQLIYFEFYEKLFVRAHALSLSISPFHGFSFPFVSTSFFRFLTPVRARSIDQPPARPFAVFHFSKRIKIHIKIAWLENRRYKNSTRENNSHFSV